MKNTNIFDYVVIVQNPLPLVIKRNHLETPLPLFDYIICERPLITVPCPTSLSCSNIALANGYGPEVLNEFRMPFEIE